jgi:hypothetical protein
MYIPLILQLFHTAELSRLPINGGTSSSSMSSSSDVLSSSSSSATSTTTSAGSDPLNDDMETGTHEWMYLNSYVSDSV